MKNLLFAAALTLAAAAAHAQDVLVPAPQNPAATPGIRGHQANQRARIRQGVASGELNQREAARMRGREAAITAEKRAAKADGVVTRDERQGIRQDQQKASRAIYRQKHDGQVR